MPSERIRPLALCVFLQSGRILVTEAHDEVKGQSFCRPLGGGIEFGETSTEAVKRELLEEIDAEVVKLHLLGTLENIFTYQGIPGHEIVLVYNGEFADRAFYQRTSIPGVERVAVGTRIAPRPPHRSVRAALPHTAPALSHDAKRSLGYG